MCLLIFTSAYKRFQDDVLLKSYFSFIPILSMLWCFKQILFCFVSLTSYSQIDDKSSMYKLSGSCQWIFITSFALFMVLITFFCWILSWTKYLSLFPQNETFNYVVKHGKDQNYLDPQMAHLYVFVAKPLALIGRWSTLTLFWEGFVLDVGTWLQDFDPIETWASARSDTDIGWGGLQLLFQFIPKLFDRVKFCALCRPARLFHTRLCKSFHYCPPFVYTGIVILK